jgi:hypothetical protein
MTQPIAPTLGKHVTSREFTWYSLVLQAWGSEFSAPDHGAYEFSGGIRKDSTDRGLTGLYGVDVPLPFEFDDGDSTPPHPDTDATLQRSDTDDLIYLD